MINETADLEDPEIDIINEICVAINQKFSAAQNNDCVITAEIRIQCCPIHS